MKNNSINFNKLSRKVKKYKVDNFQNLNENNFILDNINYRKISNLTSGSYGKIDLLKDQSNNIVVNKKAINKKSEKSLVKEIQINCVLSAFQYLYLKGYGKMGNVFFPKLVPRVLQVYKDTDSRINLIIEKYDGDVFNYFKSIDLADPLKEAIFIDFLYKIACKLKLLQKYFNFMHNDLKSTNIFYKIIDPDLGFKPDNLRYIIGDLGGAFIIYNGSEIKGDILGISSTFHSGKDIFMLLHIMIAYIESKFKSTFIEYIEFLFGDVDKENSSIEDKKWHQLYTKDSYPENYNPTNVINRIKDLYPKYNTPKDCLNVTGINFNNKYQINYN